jgi:dimethylamine monooxygenase subunit A
LFLERMKPGVAWLRTNWGLSASPELDQHPERQLSLLNEHTCLEEVWLRIEHQALVTLPRNNGILFGIRLHNYALADVKQNRAAADGLIRALQTLPEAMADYKRLAQARSRVIELLS